jgi:hypothetical protein
VGPSRILVQVAKRLSPTAGRYASWFVGSGSKTQDRRDSNQQAGVQPDMPHLGIGCVLRLKYCNGIWCVAAGLG